jgi:hypothetical protein
MGEKRNAYWILVGKPEGKRPLGRPRSWWMDNIKIDLREIGWDGIVTCFGFFWNANLPRVRVSATSN